MPSNNTFIIEWDELKRLSSVQIKAATVFSWAFCVQTDDVIADYHKVSQLSLHTTDNHKKHHTDIITKQQCIIHRLKDCRTLTEAPGFYYYKLSWPPTCSGTCCLSKTQLL